MELVMLGTGAAAAVQYYNTCFTLSENGQSFLVDTGGGNGILKVLKENEIPLTQIHDIFISHGHNDHMLGAVWVITMIGQLMNKKIYEGELRIYCHQELSDLLVQLCFLTLHSSITDRLGTTIRFIAIKDGEEKKILNTTVRFFDIQSTKLKQFGFVMTLENGRRIGFCGDEPLEDEIAHTVEGCDWLIHEAFCLYSEREKFHPYRRHHSTVKDACETAEKQYIKNLILCHTEETHLEQRKFFYYNEGKPYFHGNLFIPEDGERFEI